MTLTVDDFQKIGRLFKDALQEQFIGLSERLADLETKVLAAIQRMSRRIDQLPTRSEVDDLHERVRRLEAQTKKNSPTTIN